MEAAVACVVLGRSWRAKMIGQGFSGGGRDAAARTPEARICRFTPGALLRTSWWTKGSSVGAVIRRSTGRGKKGMLESGPERLAMEPGYPKNREANNVVRNPQQDGLEKHG